MKDGAGEIIGDGFFGPDAAGSENAGEDAAGTDGETASVGDYFGAGALEFSHTGGFIHGFCDPLAGKCGFNLENSVNAFGGDVQAGFVGEQRRRIKVVENGEVDLAGAVAVAIDDEGRGAAVALGKIAIEQFDPVLFGGGAGGRGVLEHAADGELGEHFVLDPAEGFGEVDLFGIGMTWHSDWRIRGERRGGDGVETGSC